MASPSPLRRPFGVLAWTGVAVLVASCGSSTGAGVAAPGDRPAASIAAPTPGATTATGQLGTSSAAAALLDFTTPLVGGSQLNAASFLGKPVAFWFWAPG